MQLERARLPAAVAAGCVAVLLSVLVVLTGTGVGREPGRQEPAPDFGTRPAPTAAVPAAPPAPAAVAAPAPVRLLVPALRVDAPVDPVGIAPDGAMELPADPARVGWYRFGPVPGAAAGSTVLAGHVDSRTRGLGVLAGLRRARSGQLVTVVDAGGGRRVFRVEARQRIRKQALPLAELFRRDGRPVLTLVTCTGPYDRERGGYQENLVVTAVAAG